MSNEELDLPRKIRVSRAQFWLKLFYFWSINESKISRDCIFEYFIFGLISLIIYIF